MKMERLILLSITVLFLSSVPSDVSAAKILGIFPHIGKSHFFVFEPLMRELAARGHDVHVFSHFPQKTPLPNYTDVSLEGTFTEFEPTGGVTFDMISGGSLWQSFFFVQMFGSMTCDSVLKSKQVQNLLKSNEKYDLIITELFNTDCFLGFQHLFKTPQVALSSTTLMPWSNDRFGNPDNPAYIPNNFGSFSNRMNFKERLFSAVQYLLMKFFSSLPFLAQHISKEHFGESAPSVEELARNTSLILTNSHWSLTGVRPLVPAVVEVGGIHVKPPRKLPEELDRWMNESKHGVVYFSMGSMLRADSFPAEKRAALLQAFGELPQRVLWKWEGDSLPGQPDNVRVAKWLPQRDILNHPNVRVFMTHCGMLGLIEAVVNAVPMVATPIFGDQHMNCKAIETKGAARVVQYGDISKESILNALKAVLEDPSYQENAKRLAKQYLDRPLSPMDTAIYWIEYVIRYKEATHMRSAAVELSWYQFLLLDVALVLLTAAFLLLFIAYLVIKKIVQCCNQSKENRSKSKNPIKID